MENNPVSTGGDCETEALFSSLPHFLIQPTPFQRTTSFSPLHAEGKNTDSAIIIQQELLKGDMY